MTKKSPEIPDWENDNPFVPLGNLVDQIPIAILATAIEKVGIYTWDRFGRFVLAKAEDQEKALSALALQHEWEIERFHGDDPRSPLDQAVGTGDSNFDLFGWATMALPDFDQYHVDQVELPKAHGGARRKAPDVFVAAMVKLLVEIGRRDPKIDVEKMPGTKKDLLELAIKFDTNLDHTLSTFDSYLEPICKFTRGSRTDGIYRKLFPEYF